ncbi:MAG: PAAR domain-containing protein [candidate division Zixibacteria bacterium]|nr:PAAR domain-containing protein [candidate division Zixibacteria bacterium]
MGKPAARLGDMTAHGGTIVIGAPTVLIGGQPAACVGDMHVCPMVTPGVPPIPHVGGPIIPPGAVTVLICGRPAACVGDMATCVGPPDTIIPPGCPTVLIGPGGGGGGGAGGGGGSGGGTAEGEADGDTGDLGESVDSAGSSGSGGEESTEGEIHFLDVKFTDKAGHPITGVGYKMTDPDSNVSRGSVTGGIKNSDAKEGNYEIALRAITGTKWSADSARDGETVKMQVETSGFDDDTAAVVQVWQRDYNRADKCIKKIEDQTVQSDKIEIDWVYEYSENQGGVFPQTAREPYSSPVFYFTVKVASLTSRSDLLEYKDWIEIELLNEDDSPAADTPYEVHFSNGEVRNGNLDSDGRAREERVPTCTHEVRFPQPPDESEDDATQQEDTGGTQRPGGGATQRADDDSTQRTGE